MLTPDEERQLKEILYLLLEKVRATKAAFYLVDPGGQFRLATQYGFGRSDRLTERLSRNHPVVECIFEHREPYFVNELRQAGKLASVMEPAASTRILTAPLYLEGRVVGVLDVRDKAGRDPFTNDDLVIVNEVLRRFAVRVRAIPRFGSLTEAEESPFEFSNQPSRSSGLPSSSAASSTSASAVSWLELGPTGGASFDSAAMILQDSRLSGGPEPMPELSTAHLPSSLARTAKLVEDTLASASSARVALATQGLHPKEPGFHKLFLETCLLMPEVEAAVISSFAPGGLVLTLHSRRPVHAEAEPALLENLEKVFARSGAGFPLPERHEVRAGEPSAADLPPLRRSEIAAIQSSVLHASPDWVLILSLVLGHGTGEPREELKNVHLLARTSLSEIRSSLRIRETYRGLVNRLLEPGLRKYTALKTHSFNVGRVARRFAHELGLGSVEVEQVTVAAILHDVGMRDLNYDELYSKRTLSEEELRLVREHPRVGAYILDEVPWPYPVAPLVRHHHERWDGSGYPSGLRGEDIPFGSRLIHICEAFDAMTSPTSYRQVISATQALDLITQKGGTQFDPALIPAFANVVETLSGREPS